MSISVVSDKPKFLTGSDDRVFKTLVNSGEKGKIILEAILKTVFNRILNGRTTIRKSNRKEKDIRLFSKSER